MEKGMLESLANLNQRIGQQKSTVERIRRELRAAEGELTRLVEEELGLRRKTELNQEIVSLSRENQRLRSSAPRHYTENEVIEARRRILRAVMNGNSSVAEIEDAAPEIDRELLIRELRVLAQRPESPVYHNGKRGRGSRYLYRKSDD